MDDGVFVHVALSAKVFRNTSDTQNNQISLPLSPNLDPLCFVSTTLLLFPLRFALVPPSFVSPLGFLLLFQKIPSTTDQCSFPSPRNFGQNDLESLDHHTVDSRNRNKNLK